jgi:NADPH:quinone reductase-like Zn-dependent oxidoreductase
MANGKLVGATTPMRAAVLTGYGGVDRLELREVARPEPGPGQLLVRVRAAGVNPIDWKIRQGRLRLVLRGRLPLILGFDIAGEVVAIGPEVTAFEPGDAVYAMLDSRHGGGYAEYAAVGDDAAALKPEALSYEQAAAVPLAALTALQALRDLAEVQHGQRVAITGASGGVGHFAVQLAADFEAHVTAVAGPEQQDFVRRLGANRTVDYTREDFTAVDAPRGAWRDGGAPQRGVTAGSRDDEWESADWVTYDAIFDAAGVSSFGACEPALEPGGVYVTTRVGPVALLEEARTRLARLLDRRSAHHACLVRARPSGDDLAELGELIAAGRLRPEIERVYELDDVRQAHAAGEAGHRRGKLVLRVP